MISRGIVSTQDRTRKRKFLHNLIRRLVQVPDVHQVEPLPQHTADQQTPCLEQIKSEPTLEDGDEDDNQLMLYPEMSLTEDDSAAYSSEETYSRADSEDLHHSSLNLSRSSSNSSSQRKRRPDRRIPDRMSQLSEAALSELVVPVSYNSRMARAYPKEQVEARTPAERERREKNTLAARHSRAKMRVLDELLQREGTAAKEENGRLKVEVAASFSYATVLMEQLGMPVEVNFMDVWNQAWQGEMGLGSSGCDEIKEEPRDKDLSADESKIEDEENEE